MLRIPMMARQGTSGCRIRRFLGETACSLTDDLQVMDNPGLDQLVGLEDLTTACGVAANPFDGFEDVEQPVLVAPHSGRTSSAA
jgi:hypothetical protein